MPFTIDSPTQFEYTDTRHGSDPIQAVHVEATAIVRSIQDAVERQATVPEPTGYRIIHVFQVEGEDEDNAALQYVESMDVETWEHIAPAIDVMMIRTRAEGWTVSITVAQLNLPRGVS